MASRQNTRAVWKCNLKTHDKIERYESIKAAAEAIDSSKAKSIGSKIVEVLSGKRKSSHGFFWEYDKHEEIEGEVWCDVNPDIIDGLTGYSVSSEGRVKNPHGKLLLGSDDGRGYLRVGIGNRVYSLHVLIASVFVPKENNETNVLHLDNNRLNNRASNLRWL